MHAFNMLENLLIGRVSGALVDVRLKVSHGPASCHGDSLPDRSQDALTCHEGRIAVAPRAWDDPGVNGSEAIGEESSAPPRTWDSTIGPDGIGYLIEAAPSGVIGWKYDQVLDFDCGIFVSIAGALWNLWARLLFWFGWQVKVSRMSTRWPHRRKVVGRSRMRRKTDALAQFPDLVEAVHREGPRALSQSL